MRMPCVCPADAVVAHAITHRPTRDFWAHARWQVLRTMPVSPTAGSSSPHRLPSDLHPSDHLPVGALLRWPGAPLAQPNQRCSWQQMAVESVTARS